MILLTIIQIFQKRKLWNLCSERGRRNTGFSESGFESLKSIKGGTGE